MSPFQLPNSGHDGAKSQDVDADEKSTGVSTPSQSLSAARMEQDTTDDDGAKAKPVENRDEESGAAVVRASTKTSVNNVSSIPNGGTRAWLQVLGSFFIFFNTWGVINTFGVYQTQYQIGLLQKSTPSAISWIGSVQSFLLMLVGALTGPVYDAGYFRELLWGGSFLLVFGHMMLSLCTKYWQVLLAQAFCIGAGAGCLFVPGVAILSTYFNSRLALTTGIAAAGSSLGGVIYPIMLHKLIPEIGFGWAVRVIGFMILATLTIPNLCMKVRVLPPAKRPLIDKTAFVAWDFMLFCLGGMVGFMGLYTMFFYVQDYALQEHITSENIAFYLVSMLNSGSVFGRILPNFIADKFGPLNIIIPCALMSGVLIFCLISASNVGGIVAIVVLFGFFSGTFVSLPPTIVVHMTANRGLIGTRLGMCFAFVSIGVLIGTPIAGVILSASGFTDVWIFGGTLTVAGGLIIGASRVAFKGWKLGVKA